MHLDYIQTFLTVVQTGSFSEAAQRLHLTQSTVSQQVANVEAALGVQLLSRHSSPVTLTRLGARIHPHLAHTVAAAEEAREIARRELQKVSGVFRIGAGLSLADHLVPRVLGALRRQHPDLQVQVTGAAHEHVVRLLLQDLIDLGLIAEKTGFSDKRLKATTVGTEELVLVVYPGHPWAQAGEIDVADLQGETLITRERGSGSRRLIEATLRSALNGRPLNVGLEMGSNTAAKTAVAERLGVAILSGYAVQDDLDQGRLVQVLLRGLRFERTLYAITLRGSVKSYAASALVAMLRDLPVLKRAT